MFTFLANAQVGQEGGYLISTLTAVSRVATRVEQALVTDPLHSWTLRVIGYPTAGVSPDQWGAVWLAGHLVGLLDFLDHCRGTAEGSGQVLHLPTRGYGAL